MKSLFKTTLWDIYLNRLKNNFSSLKTYTNPEWIDIFKEAGYPDFDSWWNAEENLVDDVNCRGKDNNVSWSHVSRIKLPNGRIVYLKRQQNHYPTNTLLKLQRITTFEIEWQNYLRLQAAGISTLRYVYFSTRKHAGRRQSILVSEELEGMIPLKEYVEWCEANSWAPRTERLAMLEAIVKVVKPMHAHGIIHNELYPRHIYINIPFVDGSPVLPENYKVCLIDLERAKYPGPQSRKLINHDICKMWRRTRNWPARDGVWFLKKYLGIEKLTPESKKLARKISTTREK
jgi:hypothetical protein